MNKSSQDQTRAHRSNGIARPVLKFSNGQGQERRIELRTEQPVRAGWDIDNDIVIRDQRLVRTQVEIFPQKNCTIIECLQGQVQIGQRTLSPGEIEICDYPALLTINGFTLTVEDTGQSDQSEGFFQSAADLSGQWANMRSASSEREASSGTPPASKGKGVKWLQVIAGILVAGTISYAVTAFWPNASEAEAKTAINHEEEPNCRTDILGSCLSNGIGSVDQPMSSLSKEMNSTAIDPYLSRMVPQADIERRVLQVLQVMGYQATVRSDQAGRVSVKFMSGTADELRVVERVIRQDVPSITELIIESPDLKNRPDPAGDALLREFSASIDSISTNGLAHVVTREGSRYFVGAQLPSGHELVLVSNDYIKVEKDGHQQQVQF